MHANAGGVYAHIGGDSIIVRRVANISSSRAAQAARMALHAHRHGRAPVLMSRHGKKAHGSHARRPAVRPVTSKCVSEAARLAGIPRSVLLAILWVEGGQPGGVHRNANGTYDLGPMQINTIWIPVMRSIGLTPKLLIENGCANVLAGAMILRLNVYKSGGLIRGVGHYHSSTAQLEWSYLKHVVRFLRRYRSGDITERDVIARTNSGVSEE